jgi:hypothetical protein
MFDKHKKCGKDHDYCFSESSAIRSDDTYAKDRIRSARLKLNGINPAVITAYVCKMRLVDFDMFILVLI